MIGRNEMVSLFQVGFHSPSANGLAAPCLTT